MRHLLQLAAVTLLTATTAHAQLHMPQLSHKEPKETREEVAWLAPYANPAPNGRESELVHDLRFKTFLRDHFTAPQIFWNDNESLTDTIMEFLSVPNQVVLDDNRYLSADGCVPHFCPSRGLLFVDLGTAHPLTVFAAVDWVKENKTPNQSGAEYTLWLFCNRPLRAGDDAEATHIPAALKRTIARWTAQPVPDSTTVENITNAVLVDPDGTPHNVPPPTVGVGQAQSSQPKAQGSAPTEPPSTEAKK
jgi:hypothetical protein